MIFQEELALECGGEGCEAKLFLIPSNLNLKIRRIRCPLCSSPLYIPDKVVEVAKRVLEESKTPRPG